MVLLRNVFRVYSYIFEAVLCVMGLLFSVFGLASRNLDVHLAWLPWGPDQLKWVIGLSMLGLVCVALAVLGWARILLFLFSGAVVVILARGLFLSPASTFAGGAEARRAVYLVLAATLAFLGAFPLVPARKKQKPRWPVQG